MQRGKPMNKVFVYNDVMCKNVRDKLKIYESNVVVAESVGKMYTVYGMPIMLNLKDVSVERGCRVVLGTVLEFEPNQMDKVIYALDSYHGSSQSRIDDKHPLDLTYRTTIKVCPLNFNNIHELKNYKYEKFDAIDCYAYIGNTRHKDIVYNVKVDRHHRLQGYNEKLIKILEESND